MAAESEKQAKYIVYVEDDARTVDLVKIVLRREGYVVTGAPNGREGLKLIAEVKPDLVLLDLMMPDMDGWEVYQTLRAQDATRDLPVIIITAKAASIDKVLGLHIAKVNDYITKPFAPNDLVQAVRKVLAHRTPSQP
ncbi:MAG: response regulator [Anaerolineae bacterium]|nr:response regulator [Anaerolineae bacterium]